MGLPAALAREPWAISQKGFELVIAIASRDEFYNEVRQQALSAREGRPLDNSRAVTMRGDVAVIPVEGPLFRHASLLSAISGAASYADVRKDLQTVMDDPAVRAVIFDVDSPGGEVNGVAELAAAIYSMRGRKPMAAYIGGTGASAAYWIASATGRVVGSPTAEVGSIGVVATYAKGDDDNQIEIVSSQSPNKRLDPEDDADRKQIQAKVDDLAQVFVNAVAVYRGISPTDVVEKFGRGGTAIGAKAVAAGMMDAVGDFESLIAEMSQRGAAAIQQRMTMEKETEMLAALQRFESEVFVATGASDRSAALGAIQAMKTARTNFDALSAEVTKLRGERRRAEFDALLTKGENDHQISPAMASGDWIKGLREREDGVEQLRAFLASAPRLVESKGSAPKEIADAPTEEFTEAEIKVARAFVGDDPAAIAQRIRDVRAANINPLKGSK